MKKISNYFLKNNNTKSQIDYEKSKVLLIIVFVGGILTALRSIALAVNGDYKNSIGTLPFVLIVIIILILFRKNKVNIAGNIITGVFHRRHDPFFTFLHRSFRQSNRDKTGKLGITKITLHIYYIRINT